MQLILAGAGDDDSDIAVFEEWKIVHVDSIAGVNGIDYWLIFVKHRSPEELFVWRLEWPVRSVGVSQVADLKRRERGCLYSGGYPEKFRRDCVPIELLANCLVRFCLARRKIQ